MRVTKSKPQGNGAHSLAALIPTTVAIVSLASLILLAQTGRMTIASYEVQRMEQTKASWEARNHQLEAEIAALRALDRIETLAKARLGMTPAQKYLFVQLPPEEPDVALEKGASSSPPDSSPWWQQLLRSLAFWQR